MQGIARFSDGSFAENNIDLRITVDDENDCPPVIKAQQAGAVQESSAAGIAGGNQQHSLFLQSACRTSVSCSPWSFSGTVVMKVIATDADQKDIPHSQISYKIASESNLYGLFYINSRTGEVIVQQSSLDREVSDSTNLKFFLWSSVTNHTFIFQTFPWVLCMTFTDVSNFNLLYFLS